MYKYLSSYLGSYQHMANIIFSTLIPELFTLFIETKSKNTVLTHQSVFSHSNVSPYPIILFTFSTVALMVQLCQYTISKCYHHSLISSRGRARTGVSHTQSFSALGRWLHNIRCRCWSTHESHSSAALP